MICSFFILSSRHFDLYFHRFFDSQMLKNLEFFFRKFEKKFPQKFFFFYIIILIIVFADLVYGTLMSLHS